MINDKLTWSLHIPYVVAKANKILGFLRRDFGGAYVGPDRGKLLYLSLVRFQLCYASEVWARETCITDLKLLEGVERRATCCFILGCNSDPTLRHKSRLISLNLFLISYWLICRDLCFIYKYINGSYSAQLSRLLTLPVVVPEALLLI